MRGIQANQEKALNQGTMNETKKQNIKRYWATHKSSYRKVARMFRVSHTTVMNIVKAQVEGE